MSFNGPQPTGIAVGRGLEATHSDGNLHIGIGSGVLSEGDVVKLVKATESVFRQQREDESMLVLEHIDNVLTARRIEKMVHLRLFTRAGISEFIFDVNEIAALRALCEEVLAFAAAKALAAEGKPDAR